MIEPITVEPMYVPRIDALTDYETKEWRDTGCPDGLLPSCLACPLEECRYDVPGGLRAILNRERDARMREAREAGATVDDIAEAEGVSRRTVFRALAEYSR